MPLWECARQVLIITVSRKAEPVAKPNPNATALNLPPLDPLPEATQKYFDICDDKLGMIPNVLAAYAFDVEKLNSFTAMYNDLMLGQSNLSKLEREMIAVVVSAVNRCFYCLTAHGQAGRALSWLPGTGGGRICRAGAACTAGPTIPDWRSLPRAASELAVRS